MFQDVRIKLRIYTIGILILKFYKKLIFNRRKNSKKTIIKRFS